MTILAFFLIWPLWSAAYGASHSVPPSLQDREWVYQLPRLQCKSSKDFDFDKSECRKEYYNELHRGQCQSIGRYHVRGHYRVECYNNYQHYNSLASIKYYKKEKALRVKSGRIRIGGFNMFRPISNQSLFKDLELVARIIHKEFDLLAGTELISLHRKQRKYNNRIEAYIRYYEDLLKGGEVEKDEKKLIMKSLDRAMFSYIVPGHIRILEYLRKLDPTWALLLAPRPESSRPEDVKEFVGYYYRASVVRPVPNAFCSREISLLNGRRHFGRLYACLPWFNKKINKAFSRKPFIADFESGNFRFTMLSSHVVFKSPPRWNKGRMAEILGPAFGISDYRVFPKGSGIDGRNYARWAEVKLTLDLIQSMRKKHDLKNIIYVADFNLPKNLPMWDEVLRAYPGGRVYIDAPTTISATSGLANNYDHFILDPSQTTPCLGKDGSVEAQVVNFLKANYVVKKVVDPGYEEWIWENFMAQFDKKWAVLGVQQKDHQLIIKKWLSLHPYEPKTEYYEEKFQEQIVSPKKELDTLFNRYIKVVSDHIPISLKCRIN